MTQRDFKINFISLANSLVHAITVKVLSTISYYNNYLTGLVISKHY